MDPDQRRRRRVVFNDVPEPYDSVRPGYPPKLFDDLFAFLGKHMACRFQRVVAMYMKVIPEPTSSDGHLVLA